MKTIFTFFAVLLLLAGGSAYSQCTSCTYTVSASSSSSYNLNTGETLCITGGTFSGSVNVNGGNSKICLSGTAIFTGSISSLPSTSQVYVGADATFQPSSFNNLSGTLTNDGIVSIANSVSFAAGFVIYNNGNMSFGANPNFNGAVTVTNTTNGVMNFTTTFQFGNTSTMTNNGTVICLADFQNDVNAAITNNGYFFLQSGSSNNFNPNGPFTNYGLVYADGFININSNSTVINYCTLFSKQGFNNNSSNTKNYGNIYIKLLTSPSQSDFSINRFNNNAAFYNGPNGYVQGVNFFNSSGGITGGGSFYFSNYTLNQASFTGTANFYDATHCSPSAQSCTASSVFDVTNTAPAGTITKNTTAAQSDTGRPTTCSVVISSTSGSNSDCGNVTAPTSLITNGSFATAITGSTGNTYTNGTNGVGTTYSFSGGSFISETDNGGSGATACPKSNSTSGNAFAIVQLAANTSTYTGASPCSNTSQKAFPGDVTTKYNVAAANNFMYVYGNASGGNEYLAWEQNLTGLTVGTSYTFYFYATNMFEPANEGTQDPIIRVRYGGTAGKPNGTLGIGPIILDATSTQNSAPLNGWKRFAYTFTATATSIYLKITDGALGTAGDEWGLTAIGVSICPCTSTPVVSYTCTANAVSLYESTGASWLWTTTTGGRFYTSSQYSVSSDSDVSHKQAPYVKFYGTYTVAITTALGCTGTGSVTVPSGCSTVLAVALLDFMAKKQGSATVLTWGTATETNLLRFEVERSSNAASWVKIGSVAAHINSAVQQSYSFTDGLPLNGANYYRLKQVDGDGNYHYSETRSVNAGTQAGMRIYPNPSADHLGVDITSDKSETAQVTIVDAGGRVLLTRQQGLVTGNNTFSISYSGNMADGLYLIKINTGSKIYTEKFIKVSR